MVDKISKITLWCLMGLSIAIFLLFCFVGFDNPDLQGLEFQNNVTSVPMFTDLLMIWTYFLVAAAVIATIASVISGMLVGGGNSSENGPAKYTNIIAWGIFVIAIVAGAAYGFACKDESLLINGKDWNNPTDIILTDTSMISIIVLSLATIAATVFSMINIKK